MEWQDAVQALEPYIVGVKAPNCCGTGFSVTYAQNTDLCGIATAAHVVNHAHYWEEPLRLVHHESNETILLRANDRVIFLNQPADTACIVFPRKAFPLPNTPVQLPPEDTYLRVGNEIAWLGFPAIAPNDLCFFSGRISTWVQNERAYLVDGVAINGVSGGPAFTIVGNILTVMGIVSSYIANRRLGEALPGLCVVRDVAPFREPIKKLTDIDQAREEQKLEQGPAPAEPDSCKPQIP